MAKTTMKLVCYCCGAAIGKRFVLVAAPYSSDRAFTMLPEHRDRVEKEYHTMVVKETK